VTPRWPLRYDHTSIETNSLRGRALLSTYATLVQGLVRLVYSVLVGRLGSRELLGQTNTSLSMSVLTSQLWAAPANAAGTKYVALKLALEDDDGAATVARHISQRTAVISMVLPTTACAVGGTLLDLGTAQVIATCVLAWAYSMYSTLRGVQYGAQRFRRVALWDTIAAVTALGALGIVLGLDLRPAILAPLALGYAVFAAASWPARTGSRVEPGLRREIDRFILYGAVSGLASGGLLQASQLAAHHYGGPDRAGSFAAALSLATPASMLAIAMSTVIVPPLVAAASRGDRAAVRGHSDAIARQLGAIFVGLFGVMVIGSPLGIALIYGGSFKESATLLPVLLIAVLFASIAMSAATTLQSTRARGPGAVAALNFAGLVVSLALWPFLANRYGMAGVAYGYLAGSLVASAGALGLVWWVERHVWWDLLLRLLGGLAVMVGLARLVSGLSGPWGALAQLAAALAFAGLWVLLNWRQFRSLLDTVLGRTG
jgi:putative peptidoglycan lipid II flippase